MIKCGEALAMVASSSAAVQGVIIPVNGGSSESTSSAPRALHARDWTAVRTCRLLLCSSPVDALPLLINSPGVCG